MRNRREFVFGAAAAVAVGAIGMTKACANRSKVASQLSGAFRLEHGAMDSSHMTSPVGWTIAFPTAAAKGVVYCLHGYGEDHNYAFDRVQLPNVVAAAGAALVIAGVDGGRDSYWHPRADGTDAMAMLLDEFIPMVERQLPGPVPRALLGWSMGGYGALLAAEQVPDRFRAVAAASPAIWNTFMAASPGAFDGRDDFRRFDVFAGADRLRTLTVRVDCGTGDRLCPAARQFVTRLPVPNQGGFGPGAHDAKYWRSIAPAQIATIAGALG